MRANYKINFSLILINEHGTTKSPIECECLYGEWMGWLYVSLR